GGSVDLRLRNCPAGPQGTRNVAPDRRPRGRPKKLMTEAVGESVDVEMIDPTAPAEAPIVEEPLAETQPLEEITVNPPDVEPPLTAPTMETPTVALVDEAADDAQPTDAAQDTDVDLLHDSQDSPGHQVEDRQEVQQDDNTTMVTGSEQPRYFTRATRKRALSDTDEESIAKRVRAMIAHLLSNSTDVKTYLNLDHESAFPAEVIAGIQIPRSYREAINGKDA
ncbi:hypothetical protein E4U23_000747, partial [Claviceps purpurea]